MPTNDPSGWYVYAVGQLTGPGAASGTATPLIKQGLLSGTTPLAGPFGTQAEAQAWVTQNSSLFGPGKTNTQPPVDAPVANLPNPAGAVTSIFAPLAEIGDFFKRLTEGETWTRVGEVALGGILVYAALRGLTHGSSTVGVNARRGITKPVRKVAKAGISVAAPEARLAGRTVAKRAAPKLTERAAKHREQVAKYGQKKPYRPPAQRPPPPPRVTYRVSTIHHVKGPPKP